MGLQPRLVLTGEASWATADPARRIAQAETKKVDRILFELSFTFGVSEERWLLGLVLLGQALLSLGSMFVVLVVERRERSCSGNREDRTMVVEIYTLNPLQASSGETPKTPCKQRSL